jgi:predicted nucleotidyltransferase
MNDICGLSSSEIDQIRQVLKQFPSISKGIIFGSRAIGNYRNSSDVDISLFGTELDFKTILDINHKLNEEGTLPYHFDILNYNTISNKDLIDHINRVGICIYNKYEES